MDHISVTQFMKYKTKLVYMYYVLIIQFQVIIYYAILGKQIYVYIIISSSSKLCINFL